MSQETDARLGPPPDAVDDPAITAVMSRDIVAIDAEARLPTALHVMTTTGVRHLPVVDRGRCLGVLVETDLIRTLTHDTRPFGSAAFSTLVTTTPLRQLHRPAPQLPPTARMSDAARCMVADVSDAVLVVDGDRILGIVTATDLIRLLARRDVSTGRSAP